MKLHVTPIYGWGWWDEQNGPVKVPSAFALEATVIEAGEAFRTALGRLGEIKHPLSNSWILLSQRHLPGDGHCNLCAFREKPIVPNIPEIITTKPFLTGFAVAIISN
jgi:hypothetical protein